MPRTSEQFDNANGQIIYRYRYGYSKYGSIRRPGASSACVPDNGIHVGMFKQAGHFLKRLIQGARKSVSITSNCWCLSREGSSRAHGDMEMWKKKEQANAKSDSETRESLIWF